MGDPFTETSRVAIEKIVHKNMTPAKYGYFLSEDQCGQLVEDIVEFLRLSRSLRERGDQIFQKAENSAKS